MATTGGLISSIRAGARRPGGLPGGGRPRCATPTGWCSGPGSWFTSVIPHLMVPELRRALVETDGRVVVVLNLDEQEGETPGFGPEDHLAALARARPGPHGAHRPGRPHHGRRRRRRAGRATVAAYGAELVVADVALRRRDAAPRPAKLAAAYAADLRARVIDRRDRIGPWR